MVTNILRSVVVSALLVSAIFTCCVSADEAPEWRYFGIYGVQNWSTIFPDCDAKNHTRQSPVAIVQANTQVNTDLSPISLVLNGNVNGQVTMTNNGHTVNLDFNQTSIHISGGGLPGTFRVGGVHFHWGIMNTEGSEHTIDGMRFPIEMHVVTYDASRYDGVISASGGVNSIAVLSVLFQLSTADNSALNPVISHLPNVLIAGKPISIPYIEMQTLLPQSTSRYYRYLGSLTTPPCSESVIWSVFDDHPYISPNQLAEFRKLEEYIEPDGTIDLLSDNWRTTQPLDGRIIQRSYAVGSSGGIGLSFNAMSQMALICTMGVLLQLLL